MEPFSLPFRPATFRALRAAASAAGGGSALGGAPPAGVPPSLVCLALGNLGVEPLARAVRPSSLPIPLLLPLLHPCERVRS